MTRRRRPAAVWHARTSLKLLFTKWVALRYARFRCPRELEQPGNEMGLERRSWAIMLKREQQQQLLLLLRDASLARGHRRKPRRRSERGALAILFYLVHLHNYTCPRLVGPASASPRSRGETVSILLSRGDRNRPRIRVVFFRCR